jgi:uncharacterized protein YjbI with pentapeptide repeats
MSNDTCKWESAVHPHKCNEPVLTSFRTYAEISAPAQPHRYCILHSSRGDKDVHEFARKVEERMRAPEKIDLIDCHFPKDYDFNLCEGRTFDVPVHLSGAVFSRSSFNDAKFLKPVYFIGATFANAAFRGVTFSQGAYFIGTKFWQEADFGRARFECEADFIGATFAQRADFSGTSFSGETSFNNAVFSTSGRFFKSTFDDVTFTNTKFERDANFEQTAFSGCADFTRTEFRGWTRFIKISKKMPWYGIFRYTLFGDNVTIQEVDLSRCSFLHSEIDKVDFRHCHFGEEKEYFLGFIPISRKNVLCDETTAKTNLDYDMTSRVYRDLVKNFDEKGDRYMAIDLFYGEMECRRKQMGRWGRSFSVHALSRQITGYGVRFARSAFFIGMLILVSCLFYRYHEGLEPGEAFNQSLFGINVLLAHVYHYSEKLSSLGIAYFCFEIVLGSFLTTSFVLILQRVFTPFR